MVYVYIHFTQKILILVKLKKVTVTNKNINKSHLRTIYIFLPSTISQTVWVGCRKFRIEVVSQSSKILLKDERNLINIYKGRLRHATRLNDKKTIIFVLLEI